MRERWVDRDTDERRGEVEGAEAGDVRHAVAFPSHELACGELAVEPAKEARDDATIELGGRGHLLHELRRMGRAVNPHLSHGHEEAQLEPAVPHLNPCALSGVTTKERRLRLDLL